MEAGEASDNSKKTAPGSEDCIDSTVKSKLRLETTREILKTAFKDPKTKIHDDSLVIVNEVSRLLVLEAALRATRQAVRDHRSVVELEQVEKILPQLMLDFP